MPPQDRDEIAAKLDAAGRRAERLEQQLTDARVERDALAVEAVGAGVSYRKAARLARVTTWRVQQVVKAAADDAATLAA